MKTIIYRVISKLNDRQIITDNTFYYLLDTLPERLTIPPEYADYYTWYGKRKNIITKN